MKKKLKKRLFVDLDGTAAKWISESSIEDLYQKGYFLNLPAQDAIVNAIRKIVREGKYEVYILSCYLSDSLYARAEKERWVREHLPEITYDHCIFVPFGEQKSGFVPGGTRRTDVLLDDYTKNLQEWEGTGLKCLNGINHTRKTWSGRSVSTAWTEEQVKNVICELLYAS